jgi:flagellar protein FlbT
MPLKIHLRKGQKIIINGAVLENTSSQNISLLVKNEASILRDNDILTPEDVSTPASRAYYALQCLYLFPNEKESNLPRLNEFLDNYLIAAPSSKELVDNIKRLVDDGKLYPALKKGQELISHEHKVLSHAQKRVGKKLLDSAAAGQSQGG